LFKLLNKINILKLSEVRRLEEVGKTDNPNYCLYYRMSRHPTKSCYVFKDIFQALIDAEVLKLRPDQKKVTTNMTSFSSVQGPASNASRVVFILKGELKVLNTDPHQQRVKGLVPVPTPQGEIMWVHPDLVEGQ